MASVGSARPATSRATSGAADRRHRGGTSGCFFHARVHDARDRWSHVVRDGGAEDGTEFEFSWVRPDADLEFALDLDEYAFMLATGAVEPAVATDGGRNASPDRS